MIAMYIPSTIAMIARDAGQIRLLVSLSNGKIGHQNHLLDKAHQPPTSKRPAQLPRNYSTLALLYGLLNFWVF